MADIRMRLRAIEKVPAPELWAEIESRVPEEPVTLRRWRRFLVAFLALVVAGAAIGIAVRALSRRPGPSAAPVTGSWRLVRSPVAAMESGGVQKLFAVAAHSPRDAWAIGTVDFEKPLVEHWDGSKWSLVSIPALTHGGTQVRGISVTSSEDAWIVGWANKKGRITSSTLIEHWDGQMWTILPSPNLGDTESANVLFGVSATSPKDAWAVGWATGNSRALIEHWDGASWELSTGPLPPAGTHHYLTGVFALSPNDVWAVGYVAHDVRIHCLPKGGPSRTSPLPTAPQQGNCFQQVTRNLAEHWDGTRWRVVPTPNPATGRLDTDWLQAVSGTSSEDVWAVGGLQAQGKERTLILHWDRATWQIAPSPSPRSGSTGLTGVSAATKNSVWAVGTSGSKALVEQWNGRVWTVVPVELPPGFSFLNGVAAVSNSPAWAVGEFNPNRRDVEELGFIEAFVPTHSSGSDHR